MDHHQGEGSGYYSNRGNRFITGISLHIRKQIYERFFSRFADAERILDVGATSERHSPEANFLERFYPWKNRITAVGIEDASFLETTYPGLKFKKTTPGAPLPFADNAFDVAFSHAVIEHIVCPEERLFFLSELLRVAKAAFVTTPNRFFPVETHTKVPLLHVLWPALFHRLLDKKYFGDFYHSGNLSLLSRGQLAGLAAQARAHCEIELVRCFGLTSNLVGILNRVG